MQLLRLEAPLAQQSAGIRYHSQVSQPGTKKVIGSSEKRKNSQLRLFALDLAL